MDRTCRFASHRGSLGALAVAVVLSTTASLGSGCSKPASRPSTSASDPSAGAQPADPAGTGSPGPATLPTVPTPGSSASGSPVTQPPSGSPSLRLSAAQGVYLLDPPLPGEPLFDGKVEVVIDGKAPPADTVVDLNGMALVREMRNDDADRFWHVDPAASPPLSPDGSVTITARSGTLGGAIRLACPLPLAVNAQPIAGASLSGSRSLQLAWGVALPAAANSSFASLRGFDTATQAPSPDVLAQAILAPGSAETSLEVVPTASTGYVAELRWHGELQRNGNSDGFCGRAERIFYAN